MPGFSIDTGLAKKGPLFSGTGATPRIAAFLDEAQRAVADYAYNQVRMRLSKVLKNPTGYYESQIQTERAGNGWEVNDGRRVLYGPWLEGTGSRNAASRFKGYHTFRLTKQDVARRRDEIIKPIAAKMLRDLS